MSGAVRRIQFQGLLSVGRSLLVLMEGQADERQVGVDGRAGRPDVESLLELGTRVRSASNAGVLNAQIHVCVPVGRVDANGFFELGNGFGKVIRSRELLCRVSLLDRLLR